MKDGETIVLEWVRAQRSADAHAFRFEAQDYILRSPGGGAESLRFAWDTRDVEGLRGLARPNPDRRAVAWFGDRLADFLKSRTWSDALAAITAAVRERRALSLVFRSAAAELYALPWELLRLPNDGRRLAELPGIHLRYEWPGGETAPAVPDPRRAGGRVLFAWSAAGGRVPTAEHAAALTDAAQAHDDLFEPARDVIDHASLAAIRTELDLAARLGRAPAALHLLCHGRAEDGGFGLALGDGDGGVDFVSAERLAGVIGPHAGTLRLVVLSACQGGDAGELDSRLASVAQALHRAGVEAVVASRFPLRVDASIVLTRALYAALLQGPESLEGAVEQARAELLQREGELDWASIQLYARAPVGGGHRPFILRPYRGLLAFQPQHRRFFFGRDAEADLLRARIREAADGARSRFQVVAGASGTGKSSLVLAGLLPALEDETEAWDRIAIRPAMGGGVGALARALRTLRRSRRAAVGLAPLPDVPRGADVLREARGLRDEQPDRRLLVTIDQFEEVFTQIDAPADRLEFVRTAWQLADWDELNVVVLLTMRVDFIGRCGELVVDDTARRLDKIVYDGEHTLFIAHIGVDSLPEVIEGPAELVGLRFEPGLVSRLVEEVGGDTAALPLVQYALDELWRRREGAVITAAAYDDLEGLKGALTRSADRVVEALQPAERRQARRLMVRLVASAGDGARDLRRRVHTANVRPIAVAEARAFDRALEALVASRLLIKGDDDDVEWVEVAHEALLRNWGLLDQWLGEDRRMLHEVAVVTNAFAEWRKAEGESGYLLEKGRLAYAEDVLGRWAEELDPEVGAFIAGSRQAEDRRAARQRRRARIIAGSAVAVAVAMTGLAIFGLVSSKKATDREDDAKEALAAARIAEARARGERTKAESAEIDAKLAAQKALESETEALAARDRAEEAEESADAERAEKEQQALIAEQKAAEAQAARADAVVALTRTRIEEAINLSQLPGEGNAALESVVLAVAAAEATPQLGSAASAALAQVVTTVRGPTLGGHAGPIHDAAFSPDGRWVVTAGEDGSIRLWDLPRGGLRTYSAGSTSERSPITGLVVRRDGFGRPYVVAGTKDGRILLWSDRGASPLEMNIRQEVRSIDVSEDRRYVVVGTATGSHLVDLGTGHTRVLTTGSRVASLSLAPGKTQVLLGSDDGSVRTIDFEGGPDAVPTELGLAGAATRPAGWVRSLAWGMGARWFAAGTDDGELFVGPTDVSADTPGIRLAAHRGPIQSIDPCRSNGLLATASLDGTAKLWRSRSAEVFDPNWEAAATLRGHGNWVWAARLSPDCAAVATAGEDGTVRLWGTARGAPLRVLRGHAGPVRTLRYDAVGSRIVTGGADGTARVWALELDPRESTLAGRGDPLSGAGGGLLLRRSDGAIVEIGAGGSAARSVGGSVPHDALVFASPSGRRVVLDGATGPEAWHLEGAVWTGAGLDSTGGDLVAADFGPREDLTLIHTDDGRAALSAGGRSVVTLDAVRSARFAADESGTLVVVGLDGRLEEVGIDAGGPLSTLRSVSSVYAADLHPAAGLLIRVDTNGVAHGELASGDGALWTSLDDGVARTSVRFSPDGTIAVVGRADGFADVVDPRDGRLLNQLAVPGVDRRDPIDEITFSGGGAWVRTRTRRGSVGVFEPRARLMPAAALAQIDSGGGDDLAARRRRQVGRAQDLLFVDGGATLVRRARGRVAEVIPLDQDRNLAMACTWLRALPDMSAPAVDACAAVPDAGADL